MYKLGVIEESLADSAALGDLKPYYFSQRIENVPEDTVSVWHTNEYHIPDEKIEDICKMLSICILPTWYIHAFSENALFVVLRGKYFLISPERDKSWDEMIEYGTAGVEVEKHFLENIPLHI